MTTVRRRDFLTLMAAGAAAGTGAAKQKIVLVGGHPWVYAATQPEYDITPVLDRIFEDMSAAGMNAIELMHTALRPDDSVARIRELSRKHKLPVLGTSYSANMWKRDEGDAILKDAKLLIGRLAQVGGRTLGTSVGSAGRPKTDEELDTQAGMLRKIMAVCADNGVVLNLHNHTYEVENNEHDLKGTLARIPEVKLGPDIGWLVSAGIDPVDFIRRHGKRIVFAHLRDANADRSWPEAMGEGVMDYGAVARELRKAGFAGDLVIELAHARGFKPTRPLRESLRMSREYVRKTMGY